MSKTCTQCLKDKPRIEFYHNLSCKDGLTPKCIKCSKKNNKLYMRERRKNQKKNTLPFVYHERHPVVNPPDPNNLHIIDSKIILHFP